MCTRTLFTIFVVFVVIIDSSISYSAIEDAAIIAQFKRYLKDLDHAKIARQLVHKTNWAAMGTISTAKDILGYPMVNIVAIDDNDINGQSTGRIRFLLTDLDFTGQDFKHDNKLTVMLSDEQNLNCRLKDEDPMEPTCARTMISGQVQQLNTKSPSYANDIAVFTRRHPSATKWINTHNFYLCELNITNIYVLDYYGGPHKVPVSVYYETNLKD